MKFLQQYMKRGDPTILRGWNTFSKTVIVIIIVLTPIVFIFGYTNQISVNVIEKELQEKSLKRLSFFGAQVDNNVNQLSVMSIALSRDPGIRRMGMTETGPTSYEQLQQQEEFIQKMSLLSATSNWPNRLTIYFPRYMQVISSDYYGIYNESYLDEMSEKPPGEWVYRSDRPEEAYFAKLTWSSMLLKRMIRNEDTIVEARFSVSNLIDMMKDYVHDENAQLFFYNPNYPTIHAQKTDEAFVKEVVGVLKDSSIEKEGYQLAQIDDESYMLNYVYVESLDWYAINYTPLKQVLAPITKSRNLFYASILLVLLIGLLAAVFLFKQVQMPIQMLVKGIQKIQIGTYAHRINYKPKNEFDYVFQKFNEMAGEIQQLVEKVHVENIRFRDAQLKHLQAQINPHFLSNSMFFIKNMIAMDDKEAATRMIMNLASYYRYVTKLEHTMTTLEEEMTLIDHYLVVQNLRLERFHYETNIPDAMLALQIPRLMIQPIVENTIIHSIEKSGLYGIIHINGEKRGEQYEITVDDNGANLTDDMINMLQLKVERSVEETEGFGLWNVNQRLHYQYGQESGLQFARSPLGGLSVIIRWRYNK